jgi:hypothetical protein
MYIMSPDINYCIQQYEYLRLLYEFNYLCYLISCLLRTNFMEHSPASAGQEFLNILWNPKVHYCVHKSQPLVSILHKWIQSKPSDPISLRSILIQSSHLHPGLKSGLFHSGFHTKNLYAVVFTSMHATCSTHLILL